MYYSEFEYCEKSSSSRLSIVEGHYVSYFEAGLSEFVKNHASDDVNLMRLKYSSRHQYDFPLEFALTQIEARNKSGNKLPGFISNERFLFPSVLSAEQASNEAVARYHASLIGSCGSLLDLSAGLGIDDMTFAMKGINVTSCEIDEQKCDVLTHNTKVMGVEDKIDVICGDSIEYLAKTKHKYDYIFADPARRGDAGRRLHALSDCMPDVVGNMSLIMRHTDCLLVKCSPMLDISLIKDTLLGLRHIHIVCFRGECKEVLLEVANHKDFEGITVVDLDWDRIISMFHAKSYDESDKSMIRYANEDSPLSYQYMYEPNAGVMKTGDWKSLSRIYPELYKADANSHLFLSKTFYSDFPGKILQIDSLPDKKELKSLKNNKINVVSRNHPLSAPQIISKYSIIAGGDKFLYAFRYMGKPLMLTALWITKSGQLL